MLVNQIQNKRLKKFGVNIKSFFKTQNGFGERNTDGSKNDNISDAILLKKDYYYKGEVIHKEKVFDPRIHYTFQLNHINEEVECPNCGHTFKMNDNNDVCPYCNTHYNIEFNDKDLGGKYYYDLTMKDNKYIIKTLIIDFIFSFIISLLFILYTSRTFTIFDIIKVLIGTFLIGLILFFVFYYLDALFVLPFIRRKKEIINNKQREFWKRVSKYSIDKKTFYNNLNYSIRTLFYSEKYENIIDYDVIDYNSFTEKIDNENFYITVNMDIRCIYFNDGKIISKLENKTFKLKRVQVVEKLDGGINIIKCHNCGASIDAASDKCSYCGTKVNFLQEWYIV